MNNEEGVYTSLRELTRLEHKGRGIHFLPRQLITSVLSGARASKLRGRGLNFEELRHYHSGDDIRSMDWKATLRTGNPHVRVFTEERDRPAFVVTDQRRGMFFGSRSKMKSVVAAELTALSAWRVLDKGDRIGAILFDDEEFVEIPPRRSQRNVLNILGETVRLNRKLGSTTGPSDPGRLNASLEKVVRLAKHDCLVCVISDLTGADAETKRLLTILARHNDVVVCFVYDPLEAGLPDAGRLVFADGEGQLEIDTSHGALRDRFATQFRDRLRKAREILVHRAVPLVEISAAEDPVRQVQMALGHARG